MISESPILLLRLPPSIRGSIIHAERTVFRQYIQVSYQAQKEGVWRLRAHEKGCLMKLSSPLYGLKRRAKLKARDDQIKLHMALDQVAKSEGYLSWSHLMGKRPDRAQSGELDGSNLGAHVFKQIAQGDLVLLGARPGEGKTLLALELVHLCASYGYRGWFFTLDYHENDIQARCDMLGLQTGEGKPNPMFDLSDDMSADYIIGQLQQHQGPHFVVVDYMQLLDQKRINPDLHQQISALQIFAKESRSVIVMNSQIDRAFDMSGRTTPGPNDIRLPNPIDLSAFNGMFFLHDGQLSAGL